MCDVFSELFPEDCGKIGCCLYHITTGTYFTHPSRCKFTKTEPHIFLTEMNALAVRNVIVAAGYICLETGETISPVLVDEFSILVWGGNVKR